MFALRLRLPLPFGRAARLAQTDTHLVRSSIVTSRSPQLPLALSRSYAGPGRPKKAANEKASSDASPKPQRAAAAKSTRKPATAAAKPAKKPARKPAKKPATKPAKVPTPEERAAKEAKAAAKSQRAAEKLRKEEVKSLKQKMLDPPTHRKRSAYLVYSTDKMQTRLREGMTMGEHSKRASEDFKTLSSQEREHWNHVANEKNREIEDAYESWIKSHTPDQIRQANIARRRLNKFLPGKGEKFLALKDDRLVKRPLTAYFAFNIERLNSGDFATIKSATSTKDISLEWKAMSAAEKQKYEDIAAKDKERYLKEHLEAYGYEAPTAKLRAEK